MCGTHLKCKNSEERKLKVFCQVILCWIQNLDQRVQIQSPKYQPLKVPYSEVKKKMQLRGWGMSVTKQRRKPFLEVSNMTMKYNKGYGAGKPDRGDDIRAIG